MYKVNLLTVIICCDQIFGLIDVYENNIDTSECFIFEKYMQVDSFQIHFKTQNKV